MFKSLKKKLANWLKKPAESEFLTETDQKPEAVTKDADKRAGRAMEEVAKKGSEKSKKKQKKKSFFKKISSSITKKKITEEYFDKIFENLELILLENNVALNVVETIKSDLKKELINTETKKSEFEEKIRQALKKSISNLLIEPFDMIKEIKKDSSLSIIVFFGINGSGKTTTLAKIAYLLKKHKISSVFAASDTFRAASMEQLVKHGEALGTKVIKQTYGSDPAAVAYDAIQYAQAHKIKAVLIDTAGRMHTKQNLMQEMEKIVRVTKPDFKIFVGESITGNDAIEQAKKFNNSVGIDGIILTKADVDERGGTAISVSKITGKPIIYLGTGQKYEDLEPFDKDKIIKALGL